MAGATGFSEPIGVFLIWESSETVTRDIPMHGLIKEFVLSIRYINARLHLVAYMWEAVAGDNSALLCDAVGRTEHG